MLRRILRVVLTVSLFAGLTVVTSAVVASVNPRRAAAAGSNGMTVFYAATGADGKVHIGALVTGTPGAALSLDVFGTESCGGENALDPVGSVSVTTNAAGYAYLTASYVQPPYDNFVLLENPSSTQNSNCYPVGPDNTGWENAQDVPLSGGIAGTNGLVALHGESRWYKVNVTPDTTLTVTLSGGLDYSVAVYGDLGKAKPSLSGGGATALDALSAQSAADTFSPSAFVPSAFVPSAFVPSAFVPSAFVPSAFVPSAFVPSAFVPSAFVPSSYSPSALNPASSVPGATNPGAFLPANYSTTELVPSVFTAAGILPSAFNPLTYSSAVNQGLITYSAQGGIADKTVTVNTYQSTGSFYIRVAGNNGASASGAGFNLTVNNGSGSCAPSVVPMGSAPAALSASGLQTVIVTDTSRLGGSAPAVSDMMSQLGTLAARPEVKGTVVDLASNSRVQSLDHQADANPGCPFAENLVAGAVRDVVNSYRANPLKYVVIAGPDDVIPFFRHPDQTLLGNETAYSPPLANLSPSDAALRLGYTLSDNDYGANTVLATGTDTVPVPTRAVGRLVETASEISGMVQAYLGTSGGVLPTPSSSLVTGYDFLSLPAQSVAGDLAAGTGQNPQTLIEPKADAPANGWTATQLKTDLLNSGRHDVVFLAGHFSANDTLAADYQTDLITTDMESSSVDLKNALVFTPGCHSAYNIVSSAAVPNVTLTLDWPEEFARKQAVFIGGTGFQYGDTDFVAYSEQIYADFAHQLRFGTGPVSIGQALLAAKQDYLSNTPNIDAIGQKAVYEATLYGLPMSSINMPTGRLTPPTTSSIVSSTTAVATKPGSTLGLRTASITVNPNLVNQTLTLKDLTNNNASVTGSYLSGDNGVAVNPYQPILPLESENVSVPGQSLRGVLFTGGSYSDTTGVTPVTGAPATEIRGVHTGFQSSVFFPEKPWSVNYFDALDGNGTGATKLLVEPAQHTSDPLPATTDTRRQYGSMSFRLFYSNNTTTYGSGTTASTPALDSAPDIVEVQSIKDFATPTAHICVSVADDPTAGVQQAVVTYTDPTAATPSWKSITLTQGGCANGLSWDASPTDSSSWGGDIDLTSLSATGLRFMVQAVSGTGLVTMDDNLGKYFSLPVPPTTNAFDTFGNLQQSATSVPYGTAVTLSDTLTTVFYNGPVPNEPVVFTVGGQTATAITDTNGVATVTMNLQILPSATPYSVNVTSAATDGNFAGPVTYFSPGITVTKQPTLLTLSSAAVGPDTTSVATLCATATDSTCGPADPPVANETVVFQLSGPVNKTIALPTNSSGQVQFNGYGLPPGTYSLQASFDGTIAGVGTRGDPYYQPSTTTASFDTTTAYTTPPTLHLPANITLPTINPQGAVASYVVSATDPVDPRPQVSCNPGSATFFPVGTTTVNCTATDMAGNASQGSFTVTVNLTATPLTAGTTTCNGVFAGTGADVIVPKGAVCTLASGTTITDGITVMAGGTLNAQGVNVANNVSLTGAKPSLLCGMTIGQSLTVQNLPAGGSPTVIGDTANGCTAGNQIGVVTITSNASPVDFGSNTTGTAKVLGDVTITGNSALVTVNANTVGHDLVIGKNSGPVSVTGNQLNHDVNDSSNKGSATFSANKITHDLNVASNSEATSITGNQVGHDVNITVNSGKVTVTGNTAGHDFMVQGNKPGGAVISNNVVTHDATCSGNNPQSGSGNKAGDILACPA